MLLLLLCRRVLSKWQAKVTLLPGINGDPNLQLDTPMTRVISITFKAKHRPPTWKLIRPAGSSPGINPPADETHTVLGKDLSLFFPHDDASEVKLTFPSFPLRPAAVRGVIAPAEQKEEQTDLFPSYCCSDTYLMIRPQTHEKSRFYTEANVSHKHLLSQATPPYFYLYWILSRRVLVDVTSVFVRVIF